jgi:hypothetical protein
MTGWRCPTTKLWRVPLKPDWKNMNTETTLLSEKATRIMMEKRGQFDPIEFVNSVYELPNLEQVIAWYHAAAGYPTKTTWIKAIEAGFYATWPHSSRPKQSKNTTLKRMRLQRVIYEE